MSSKCPPDLACVLQVSPASSRFLKCPPTFSSVLCPGLRPRTKGSICPFGLVSVLQMSSGFGLCPPGFSSVLQVSQVSSNFLKCPLSRPRARTLGSICPFGLVSVLQMSSGFGLCPPGFSSVLQVSQVSSNFLKCPLSRPKTPDKGLYLSFLVS